MEFQSLASQSDIANIYGILCLCYIYDARSAQLASLQVALHVTKRPDGVNASDRVSVMVGTGACNSSQEAVRLSGSGGLLYRWPRGFDSSVCPNASFL